MNSDQKRIGQKNQMQWNKRIKKHSKICSAERKVSVNYYEIWNKVKKSPCFTENKCGKTICDRDGNVILDRRKEYINDLI